MKKMDKRKAEAQARLGWVNKMRQDGKTVNEIFEEYKVKYGKPNKQSLYDDLCKVNKIFKPKFPALKAVKPAALRGAYKTSKKRKARYSAVKAALGEPSVPRREFTKNNGELQQLIDFLEMKGLNVTKHVKEFKAIRKIFQ